MELIEDERVRLALRRRVLLEGDVADGPAASVKFTSTKEFPSFVTVAVDWSASAAVKVGSAVLDWTSAAPAAASAGVSFAICRLTSCWISAGAGCFGAYLLL